MTDLELVKSVVLTGCSGCFCKIIDMHSNLFYKICSKYVYTLQNCGIPKEDVFENKNFVFLDSINTYDDSRGVKFSTWLANKSRFFCLNLINSRKRIVNFTNEEIRLAIENKSFSQDEDRKSKEDFSYVMFLLGNLKDKRIKQIFQLRYLEGSKRIKWKNIASKMSISVQTAINLHSRGVRVISTKIKSKEVCDSI